MVAPVAHAQTGVFCNVTGVDVKRMSNGVQLTIKSDGLMAVDLKLPDFINMEAVQVGRWESFWRPVAVLPITISNARSKVGNLVDIGVYPASHVEVAIPPDSADGLGLNLRVALFTEAVVTSIKTRSYNINIGLPWDPARPTVRIEQSADQRDLVITIASNKRTETPEEFRKPDASAPRRLSVEQVGGRLWIDALNADLRDLVKVISAKAARAVVADGGLERTASLYLPGVTLHEALQGIATTYGLSLDESGPIISLNSGAVNSLAAHEQSVLEPVRLKHMTALAARASLPEFLLRFLHLDEEGNALTVFGPKALADKVRTDLAKIDVPAPQVRFEAMAVEFSSSRDFDAVAEVWARSGENRLGFKPATGDLSYAFVGKMPSDFRARLSAQLAAGRAVVKARPCVVVANGKTANLFVGRQKLVKVDYYDNLNDQYTSRLITLDLGAKVEVTPWTGGGEILARVMPEITSLVEQDARTGLPTISTRKAGTTVQIRDGDTIVIGGLNLEQDAKLHRRFASALDSPTRSSNQTELVWFVTARIVPDAQAPAPRPVAEDQATPRRTRAS